MKGSSIMTIRGSCTALAVLVGLQIAPTSRLAWATDYCAQFQSTHGTPAQNLGFGFTNYQSGICNQAFINWAWNAFGFKQSTWVGRGYEAPCDMRLPLGRTLAAVYALTY